MVHERFEALLKISTVEDLAAELVRFTNSLDFATAALSEFWDKDGSGDQYELRGVDNMPSGMYEHFDDLVAARQDPVAQHCKRSSLPIVWDRTTYESAGQSRQWEVMAAYEVKSGISLALHLPGGRHCLVGIDSPNEQVRHSGNLARVVADLQLFAVYAHEPASRLLVPQSAHPSIAEEIPHLTPRELEILRWTTEGKTAWEVGNILGISERTAVQHANNAMQKLNAVNKVQAAMKAVRLGLIS